MDNGFQIAGRSGSSAVLKAYPAGAKNALFSATASWPFQKEGQSICTLELNC